MAAVTRINERNGAGEVVSNAIANLNFGSVDASELVVNDNPIAVGENSFEKVFSLEVTDINDVSVVRTIKVWRNGALGANASLKTSARETGYVAPTYTQPTDADSAYTEDMPASEPAGANVGIGGSLAGELTGAGETDLIYAQLQTEAGATAGAAFDINIQRDEVA